MDNEACVFSTTPWGPNHNPIDLEYTISKAVVCFLPFDLGKAEKREETNFISILCKLKHVQLINTLDTRYKLSSHSHVTKVLIPERYERVKQDVVKSLHEVDHCSLTSDLWTGCHDQLYLSLTVHFITLSMKMKNYLD